MRHSTCLITIMSILILAAPAAAKPPTAKERAEFNQLVQQRNDLYVQLASLDREAAERIKEGRRPLALHGRQVAVNDELDLVELRLEMLAARRGLVVPPPPTPVEAREADQAEAEASRRAVDRNFSRGRSRALDRLEEDAREFLGSLEFGMFLLY